MSKKPIKTMLAAALCAAGLGVSAWAAEPLFKDAVQVWHFADGARLQAHGAVQTGVKLEREERAASLKRGGAGYAAQFTGGWLDAGASEALDRIDGYAFTLYVRLCVPDGKWDKPILSKHGGDEKLAWYLYGRPFGHDPKGERWEMAQQNYWPHGDVQGKGYALEFELGVQPEPLFLENLKNRKTAKLREVENGIFRVGVPVSIIGADAWHDVTVRFTGPKLELFVDGVLVDEEWPIGRIRSSPAPCLIGAADTGSNVRGGFQGQIDHAAVWNRPLSDEEIAQLSGGRAEVAKADDVILGPEKHGLQYWRPSGHNTWVGDVMPAFHDGRFHLFYLFDRRHHSSKWAPLGAGAHQFAHTSSTNLIDWEHHPLAVAITRQWETFGTGCPVFLEDRCEMHFGMHTFRMFPLEVTTQRQIEKRFVESGAYSPADMSSAKVQWPEQDVPVGHGVALSEDGIHFRKADINLTPSQNMWIFRNPPTDRFLTIWGTRLLTSGDLRHWKPVDDALLPVKRQTAANNSSECPCYFEWSGWHYVMMGRSGFWMARDAQGPYWEGPNKEDSRKVEHPRWDIYDGLIVPMAAPFKNNRRLLVGNTWSPVPHGGYAGYLVFRELIQHLDGTLGMKWPPEMIPPAGEPVAWRVNADDGGVPSESTNVRLQGDGFRKARIDGLPPSYRFTANVVPSPKVKALGVNVKARANYADGCELQFEPGESHAQWGTPSADGLAQHIAFTPDADSPHAPHRGLDFALDRVEGLDRPFKLDLIVQCDPTTKITLADACIDERRTMITHRYDLPGDALFLFVKEGEVRFEDIAIRPLLGTNREKR